MVIFFESRPVSSLGQREVLIRLLGPGGREDAEGKNFGARDGFL